jgi:D-alanyl-lipoteichoic acid acyltransferase DltB (MBOAT superfamily)
MLFNSITFAIFFTLVVLVYFRLGRRSQLVFLLAASYFFYAWWRWQYTSLLVFSTGLDYTVALLIGRARSLRWKRALLLVSLIGNLGMLFFFKYLDLFLQTAASLLGVAGVDVQIAPFQEGAPWYVLPIGISFYTFQTMSYTIDVYRGTVRPTRNPLKVALFVCYFPQLIAGPVLRANELMPQMEARHRWDWDRVRFGLLLVYWGLIKKVCFADNLAPLVDQVYTDPGAFGGLTLLFATYAFAFQIYFDFSGYSDIAIGLAQILGFKLILNFDRPYLASNITVFWRRWHISLSRWLRDYLYIPLGGNRKGRVRTYVNLMITMLLGGLWHGASWNFVVWGGLHGLALAGHKVWRGEAKRDEHRLNPLAVLVTFHFVCLTWIFFRADDFDTAWRVLTGIVSFQGGATLDFTWPFLLFAYTLGLEVFQERRGAVCSHVDSWLRSSPFLFGGFLWTAMTLAVVVFYRGQEAFIYFQF